MVEKGHDESLGARPLRRAIEHFLEDALAEELLRGKFDDADIIEVGVCGDELKFSAKSASKKTAEKS